LNKDKDCWPKTERDGEDIQGKKTIAVVLAVEDVDVIKSNEKQPVLGVLFIHYLL